MYDPQALSTNYSYCSHYLAVLVGAIAKEEIAYKNLRSESINIKVHIIKDYFQIFLFLFLQVVLFIQLRTN